MRSARALAAALVATTVATSAVLACSTEPTRPPVNLTAALGPRITLGWNLTTPELVRAAAEQGVTTAVLYGPPPTPDTPLGAALGAHHMRVITAEIGQLLTDVECTRTHTEAPPPQGATDFCPTDLDYTPEQLFVDIGKIAERNAYNPLIAGYWILDDVAGWDTGGLHDTLIQVRALLPEHQPALCGFSASLGTGNRPGWDPRRAANYSPDACDVVAPYIYARPTDPDAEPQPVDWSMSAVLPPVLESLRAQGWDQEQVPMIGIGQSWGGDHLEHGTFATPPTAAQMVEQAQAFRRDGAIGIGWYAWSLSSYPTAHTPANDPELAAGVNSANSPTPR